MPNACCIPGCMAAVPGKTSVDPKPSLFRFPKQADLRDKWVAAIGRSTWTPSEHSRVCSLHFREHEITCESHDLHTARRVQLNARGSKRLSLKAGAVPSLTFDLEPQLDIPKRSNAATVDGRRQREKMAIESKWEQICQQDLLESFDDLRKVTVPDGIYVVDMKSAGMSYMSFDTTKDCIAIAFSVTVKLNMDIEMSCMGKKITVSEVNHLLQKGKIDSCTALANIFAHLKMLFSLAKEKSELEKFQDCLSALPDDIDEFGTISFAREQIQLALTSPKSRRFSTNFISQAAIWNAVSAGLYKRMHSEGPLIAKLEPWRFNLQCNI
jgi:hypothetical protein